MGAWTSGVEWVSLRRRDSKCALVREVGLGAGAGGSEVGGLVTVMSIARKSTGWGGGQARAEGRRVSPMSAGRLPGKLGRRLAGSQRTPCLECTNCAMGARLEQMVYTASRMLSLRIFLL